MGKIARLAGHPLSVLSDADFAELLAPDLSRLEDLTGHIEKAAALVAQEARLGVSPLASFEFQPDAGEPFAADVARSLAHAAEQLCTYVRCLRMARVQLDPPDRDLLVHLRDERRSGNFGDGLEDDYAEWGGVEFGLPLGQMTARDVAGERSEFTHDDEEGDGDA